MFSILVLQVFCIFLMFVPGFVARRRGWMSDEAVYAFSNINVNIVYPCLIFQSIFMNYSLQDLSQGWILPGGIFVIFLVGYGLGFVTTFFLPFRTCEERRAFLYQAMVNNYSFLPLPLVLAIFGEKGVAALLLSTLGAEIAVWVVGVGILSGRTLQRKDLCNLLNPPLLAIFAAILGRAGFECLGLGDLIPEKLDGINAGAMEVILMSLRAFETATVALAMLVAGARLATLPLAGLGNPRQWILLLLRVGAVPLVTALLVFHLSLSDPARSIFLIVSTMPTSVGSCMMAEIYGGDKEFIATTVLSSHLLAMLTIPFFLSLFL